jgi:hypothetical protein
MVDNVPRKGALGLTMTKRRTLPVRTCASCN